MNEGQIIELDGDRDLLNDPQPPRHRRVNRWRAAGAIALIVICLASLGAARRPPLPLFQLLGVFDQSVLRGQNPGDLTLMGEMLVTQQDGLIVAYELDGRKRWAVRVFDSGQEGYLNTHMWRGLMLVDRYEPTPAPTLKFQVAAVGQTIALDLATGQEKWRLPGFLEPANDVVLLHNGDSPVQVYGSLPSGLLWTVPPARATQIDLKTNALFTLTADGLLTEFDLTTGAVHGSGTVQVPHVNPPIAPPAPGLGRYPDELLIDVLRDRLLLRASYYSDNGFPVSQAFTYDRATLRRVWSPLDDYDGTQDCGPVLCVYSRERVSVVDKEDLTILWQPGLGTFTYWTGTAMLVSDQTWLRIVEPRTGAILVDLKGWSPVAQRQTYGLSTITWLTRITPVATYVGRLDGARLTELGPMPRQIVHCQSEGMFLACSMFDGRVSTWRINLS